MPGHNGSSFVLRDPATRGHPWMKFCDLQRFRRKTALSWPIITRTDLQSPRKTAPVRRLTVNRKPLSTASRLHFHQNSPSLAQPYWPRNGLYPAPRQLLAFDRIPPTDGPKGRSTPGPTRAQLLRIPRGDGTP